MTEIDIVGGVYRERVAFPYWDELIGSAGRSALALNGLIDKVRLHTCLSEREEIVGDAQFRSVGIDLQVTRRSEPVEFDYVHTLAVPKIYRDWNAAPVSMPEVQGYVVVKFGMMEADPIVRATFAIYDPQSAFKPVSFSKNGSTAEHLAIVANKGEILSMSGEKTVDDAIGALQSTQNVEVIVVKDGIEGAHVYAGGSYHHVPAYKTRNVFSLGSGDMFVSAFAYGWAVAGMSPFATAEFASRSVAEYLETRSTKIEPPGSPNIKTREVVKKAGGMIYLAGPFRETGQRMLINDARAHLRSLGMTVFSPIHDIGPGSAELVVHRDLAAVRECDAVFAILNGSSPGTVFEVGFAIALNKPVFCVAQNMRDVDLKLPRGSGAFIHDDYVSALHQIAWRS